RSAPAQARPPVPPREPSHSTLTTPARCSALRPPRRAPASQRSHPAVGPSQKSPDPRARR
ncbi:MAG TPA: peptidoglycan-binding protein, partial [Acidimicrobiia bacterium]|nr:peptidoglycan-binding protein [Acidimicrobiia bacterium]